MRPGDPMAKKYRALVIDVSAAMRALLSHILAADPEIEVAGAVPDINLVRERLPRMNVDVLTFNAALAGRDGAAALAEIVRAQRLPVVVLGSRTRPETAAMYAVLDRRLVTYLPLPTTPSRAGEGETRLIVDAVKAAARAADARRDRVPAEAPAQRRVPPASYARGVIAIGASTGGTEAIAEVLRSFPPDAPATVIVQHMPPGFTASFAKRLDSTMAIEVKEAQEGDELKIGRALIAPGGKHMKVIRLGGRLIASLSDAEPVNRHRPSVDVLFDSLAGIGRQTVAAILTGMGGDGAEGMARLHAGGARTIAQDQDSCVVFGMPREAIRLNGVDTVLPLAQIGKELLSLARR